MVFGGIFHANKSFWVVPPCLSSFQDIILKNTLKEERKKKYSIGNKDALHKKNIKKTLWYSH